jgi:hypothetical protein
MASYMYNVKYSKYMWMYEYNGLVTFYEEMKFILSRHQMEELL